MSPANHSNAEQKWTTRKLLDWTTHHLTTLGLDSPRLSAELLLAHVLNIPRIRLYTDLDRPAAPLERAAYRELVEKTAAHHPIQYLLGRVHFYNLELDADPRALIPRPSTETLVERLIEHIRRTPGRSESTILDLCTGSGPIPIAAALNLPHTQITATDLSEQALNLAKQNARKHKLITPPPKTASDPVDTSPAAKTYTVDRPGGPITFLQGDLFAPLTHQHFDYITANPPYISDTEWAEVPPNVKDHEPTNALRAGPDGLDLIRRIIQQAPDHLNPQGRLLIEIAASQKQSAIELAKAQPKLANPHIIPDHENLPRILIADRA